MQIMSGRRVRSAVTIVALATAALLGTAGSALACHSDDGRAKPIPGSAAKCEKSKSLSDADFKFTGGAGEKRLNITGLGEGVKVTSIVVIGGDDGYNVYEPGKRKLADTPPWTELRAPFNRDGSKANIDKWYACGDKTSKPSETPKPTEPTKTTSAKPPTSAPTTTEKPSDTPTSTTAPAPAVGGNGGNGGGLADTGFDNAWLLWAGGLLVLGGAAVLVLLRMRRKPSDS
ncbi:LPXTG cell wall anchor domain-containing protein [Amycolatopsis sp. lyj-112]|uniref:LPXTG cell wall anchor domain-containing protein n=1 Tax=Amycolatopsis sp. lyj-112 TaxID=2789288 RepID=UPI00397BDCA2